MTMTIEEQRKAIIEDASRKEFEEWFKNKHPVEASEIELYEAGAPNTVLSTLVSRHKKADAWEGWQAARNQRNNVPVETIVQEIFDLCIQYERSCYNTGYLHLAKKLLELAGRANSAIKALEQTPYTSPQQSNALPWRLVVKKDISEIYEGDRYITTVYGKSAQLIVEAHNASFSQQSNALEMAHSECSACGSLTANSNEAEINNINKQLSSENERLRNLIPQSESDGK